jgi:hypothetical protein
MKSKNCIRIAVLVALVAWPAVETYRLYAANQDLVASRKLQQSVSTRLAQLRSTTQVATRPAKSIE